MGSSLHVTEMGATGPRLVFCHGLFGQGKNWTQIAKQFATDHRVQLVDMPDHGRSAWTDRFDYVSAADTVAGLFDQRDPVILVGHSMGGKIAMVLALRHPELVERLCIVDVAPVGYRESDDFRGFIDALQAMDLPALQRREDADAALSAAVPDRVVRAFLLQNLRRDGDGWRWQMNLDVLDEGLTALRGWPSEALGDVAPYDKPVLWIAGVNSGYVRDEHADEMTRLFPKVRRVGVKGAGHWVHSEQPEIFAEILRRFVDQRPA